MKKLTYFTIVAVTAVMALMGEAANGGELVQADVFEVAEVNDPGVQLLDDAAELNLDLTNAQLYFWRKGWWKLENKDYILSRNDLSGHFDLIKKQNEPIVRTVHYKKGEEPADPYLLQDEALDLIVQLGVPENEIGKVSVTRMMDQGEDECGPVGEPTTVNFIVYVHREIDGIPVSGSYAKIIYTPEGEMTAAKIKWRNVKMQSREIVDIENLATLEERAKGVCIQKQPFSENALKIFYGGYGYYEAPANTVQTQFVPQYLLRCSDGEGPLIFSEIDARK